MSQFLINIWAGFPDWMQIGLFNLVKIIAILAPLLLSVAYLTYAERKIIGYMQVRIGPNRVGPRPNCTAHKSTPTASKLFWPRIPARASSETMR